MRALSKSRTFWNDIFWGALTVLAMFAILLLLANGFLMME